MFNHLDPYSRYVAPARGGGGSCTAQRPRRPRHHAGAARRRHRGAARGERRAGSAWPASMPGDTILAVDGEAVRRLDVGDVERADRRPGGKRRARQLAARRRPAAFRRSGARAGAAGDRVSGARLADMLVLRITSFNDSTASHLEHDLRQGLADPRQPAGIVLDLRGNRGGLLRQAVDVADMLLPAGIVPSPRRGATRTRTTICVPAVTNWRRMCRWSCWSTAAPPARPRCWPQRWPTAGARWWSAAARWARAWCRRSRRCPMAASCS